MKCKHCGTKNMYPAHFCKNCKKPTKYPFYLSSWFWLLIFIAALNSRQIKTIIVTWFIAMAISLIEIRHNKVVGIKIKLPHFFNKKKDILTYGLDNTTAPVITGVKQARYVNRTFNKEEFENIPKYPMELKEAPQKSIELFEKVHYTNVTIKTNYEKLGSFVVLDTETTGLSGKDDKIVELSAIKFENWKPVEKFETLINPERKIPYAASKVNNILDDMVKDAPTIDKVIGSFNDFIKGYNLVGQNLNFDLQFLHYAGAEYKNSKIKYYDTIDLAKKVLTTPNSTVYDPEYGKRVPVTEYDIENYKLSTLAKYYGIGDDRLAHRAAYDAYVTGLIFKEITSQKTGR